MRLLFLKERTDGMDGNPLRIVPRLVERVWGRTDLSAWYGGIAGTDEAPLGEAWLTDVGCEVEGGGTLGDLIDGDRAAMLGDVAGSPPILAKLLFTAAPLSVQVHPTDAAARSSGIAASGKNEAWHVLDATPDAAVWVGFSAPVTPARLRAAVTDGSVLTLLRRRAVQAGDTVSVPAGTVHAISAGLVLLEVQDSVHVTYRLYDYGRPRPLQVEEALAVADLGAACEQEADPEAQSQEEHILARAPRFLAERHDIGQGLTLRPDGARYHILVPLTPGVLLDQRELRRGAAAFVPARGRAVTLSGRSQASVAILHPGPGPSSCLSTLPLRERWPVAEGHPASSHKVTTP